MGNFRGSQPALQAGLKISRQDLADGGLAGLANVGNVFYVDPVNGSDSYVGTSWGLAKKSLYGAHAAVTTNNYDVIIVAPAGAGSGTATAEDAALTGGLWSFSKSLVTVIGAAAPNMVSPRSRILWSTAGQSVSSDALLTISGNGNRFINLQFGTFVDNNVLVKVTGDRNYFSGVHFAGIGDATAGDDAAARSLWLADADENLFEGCYIGLDTVARSTTNAEIELTGESQRNIFRDCFITGFADNAGHLFVKAASAQDIDRFVWFKDCVFHNPVNSTATTMTAAMSVHASVGGTVILDGCSVLGVTDWASDYTAVYGCNMPDITAANAGFMERVAT